MAKYVGKGGSVDLGANVVGNLRSWSLVETAEPVELKDLGDEYQEYSATDADHPKTWSIEGTAWFDDADTAQASMTPGAQLALILGVRGTTVSFPRRTGNAIITEITESAETNGGLEMSFSAVGNGALVRDTF